MRQEDYLDDIQNESNNFNRQLDILRKDIQFLQIALILSGKREELETKAFELCRDEGSTLKAIAKLVLQELKKGR